jgi:DNA-binding PadR family transcriptional regulator
MWWTAYGEEEPAMGPPDPEVVHQAIEDHSKIFRDLLLGFVKVHVLHHASQEPIYGSGIMEDLDRHGYELSAGTLYPLLHGLDSAAFLRRDTRVVDGKVRKYYEITPLGQRALEEARRKIIELVAEIMETDWVPSPSGADEADG